MIWIKNGWPVMHGIDAIVLMLSNTMCNRDGYTYIMKKYFQKIYFNNRCHHVVNITNSLSFQFQWIKPSARQYWHENGKLISRCRKHNFSSYISSWHRGSLQQQSKQWWITIIYESLCRITMIALWALFVASHFFFNFINTRLFSKI